MEFQLNTDNTTALVRRHFGVDGMIKSIVNHHRHGDISSVEINSVVTRKGMPYFDHLKCMVMEAKFELELDNECLELIPYLRSI